MAAKSRVWICSVFLALFVFSSISSVRADDEGESKEEPSSVLTLDASNFDEAIAKHPFIVVEFYAPCDPAYQNEAENIHIHGKQLEEILFDKYIDGNVIDFYILKLEEQNKMEGKSRNIYFRTGAWQVIRSKSPDLTEHFIRLKLRSWNKNTEYMFFPLCHSKAPGGSGDHWTLLIFNAQTHEWTFYNSLQPRQKMSRYKGQYITDAKIMKDEMCKIMEEEITSGSAVSRGMLQKKKHILQPDCPQQTNGCGHCKKLAPEYEKAASLLSKHDPPVILAKVDANEEINKELANKYEVKGFPTIKIFRNAGKNIQEYKGPRETDGIVEYLKKQVGPASSEIKSSEDADNIITEKKVIIVGVFPEFSGQEFDNFLAVAEKLRSDYEFSHVLDAKVLPRGDSSVKGPIVRLFKPFDELVVDFQDFHVEALEKFIEVTSVPTVTTFNKDPANHPYVIKFFNSDSAKAMLFLNFSGEHFDALKSKYQEVALNFKGKGVSFLIGDLDASQGAFQYFGLNEDQVPIIIIQESDGQKYLKPHVEPDQIANWLKEYREGSLKPFRKSEPIPEVNNEPVKVVVADNLHDVVNSGKNVLLEFYAPWCGHCKKLAPILDEVAVSFEKDTDVIIAKMDAAANDVPNEYDVRGYPTLYFSSASGRFVQYEGGRSAEDIINFINQHRDTAGQSDEPVQDTPVQAEPVKDEL